MAPPNSTANKSSEIAPRTTGFERTNVRPESSERNETAGGALALLPPMRTLIIRRVEMASSVATVPYTMPAPAR